jgi:hypothetical protein
MKSIIHISAVLILAFISLCDRFPAHILFYPLCGIDAAYAQDDWKKEFEAICSRTDDAMSFSKDELKSLIARCDQLKSVIETLDESTRKVYLKRLKLCRDLFAFVLDAKEKN